MRQLLIVFLTSITFVLTICLIFLIYVIFDLMFIMYNYKKGNTMFKYPLTILSFLTITLSAQTIAYNFEDDNLSSWTTNAKWMITKDKKSKVLSLLDRDHQNPFNLCYNSNINFTDGTISTNFRANRGIIDQGGGLMWRVQDSNNYYVARFNPLEDNFRFYIVKDGIRTGIASVDITLTQGWHTMKIVQKGSRFEGYLDDKKVLEATDKRVQKGGGVGLWTKADALSSFDDLVIEIEEK